MCICSSTFSYRKKSMTFTLEHSIVSTLECEISSVWDNGKDSMGAFKHTSILTHLNIATLPYRCEIKCWKRSEIETGLTLVALAKKQLAGHRWRTRWYDFSETVNEELERNHAQCSLPPSSRGTRIPIKRNVTRRMREPNINFGFLSRPTILSDPFPVSYCAIMIDRSQNEWRTRQGRSFNISLNPTLGLAILKQHFHLSWICKYHSFKYTEFYFILNIIILLSVEKLYKNIDRKLRVSLKILLKSKYILIEFLITFSY